MADRKLTIRDIARLSGVSRSTVSLVLNNDNRISDETKKRVQAVIRRSGYEPNAMARGLARRRAGMVAVVVPRTSSHVFSDYYFSEAMSGIGDVLASRGYRMLIEMATEQFVREETYHKLFREGQIDGMLLIGTLTTDEYVREIGALFNVVLVNSTFDDLPSVYADNYQGARDMMNHLAGLGHRQIGFIGGLDITTVGHDRNRAYRDGLAGAGLPADDRLVAWGNFSEESGYEAARELLQRQPRPTAVFAANDMMAIGCLRAAEEFGLKIPRDLTVVGADDVSLASYVRPRLTTLRQPMYDIGRLATETLLHQADLAARKDRRGSAETTRPGNGQRPLAADPPRHRLMSTNLVVRDSSAPPAQAV